MAKRENVGKKLLRFYPSGDDANTEEKKKSALAVRVKDVLRYDSDSRFSLDTRTLENCKKIVRKEKNNNMWNVAHDALYW